MACQSKRPSCSETEEDLLKLQEKFLASKEKPSAILYTASPNNKKEQNPIVTLKENQCPLDTNSIPIHTIIQDIKERDVSDWSPPSLVHTETGFPAVHEISKEALTKMCKGQQKGQRKKKSLFAQHFESLDSKAFGVVKKDSNGGMPHIPLIPETERDRVEPYNIEPITITRDDTNTTIDYDKSSSVVWDKFLHSSVVSGEGLIAVGGNSDSVEQEIQTIHKENIAQLSKMTEEEILMEQNKLKKQLGAGIVEFLRSHKKPVPMASKTVVTNEQGRDLLGKWLHMDKIEKEKLEWMKDISIKAHSRQLEIIKEVRFSMNGMVIKRSVGDIIPTHIGLHHHGDEPEAAGYTLKELIGLCCSSVVQQRVISLKTVANILKKARHNEYSGVIEGSPMEILLESSIPKILRYALDDSSQNIQTEAIHSIHSLLVSSTEETFLDTYSYCYHGLSLPRISSFVPSKDRHDDHQETMEKDVVEGLLEMMLLPRLRYILEVCQPPIEVITMILEILIVVSRHSSNTANKVISCPRLMNVIREQLSCAVNENDSQKQPHPLAMKLIHTLCTAGRHMSKILLSKYNIIEPILRYCVLHPSAHSSLSVCDAHQLYIESARTWTVLLSYGLTTDIFSDIFPTLLQLLSSHTSLSTINSEELIRYSTIFNLLTVSIHVSTIAMTMSGAHPLSWSHAEGLIQPALICLNSAMSEIQNMKDVKDFSLDRVQYISSIQHLVATYYTELMNKPELRRNPIDLLQQVESLVSSFVTRFETSKLYDLTIQTINSCLEALPSFPPSLASSLPSIISVPPSSLAIYGHTPPVDSNIQSNLLHNVLIVFVNLLWSHVRLSQSIIGLHKGVAGKLIKSFTSDKFLSLVNSFKNLKTESTSWFMIPLYLLLHSVTKIIAMEHVNEDHSPSVLHVMHECVFKLLSTIPPGLENCAVELLSTIFQPIFYKSLPSSSSIVMATMLPSMTKLYLDCLKQSNIINNTAIISSVYWLNHNSIHMDSLHLPCYTKPLLPIDWPHLPLVLEYNNSQQGCHVSITMIAHTLQYILLLERYHSNIMCMIPAITRVSRIMCVLLAGTDLFLDVIIRPLLSELLQCYCSVSIDCSNLTPATGLPPFPDFFVSLLDHYSAVSYGDKLFSHYVLLPIQQNQSHTLRRIFWLDHTHITRIITLGLSEVSIPINSFLYPIEQEWDLVEQYLRLLVSDSLIGLLYSIAIHHVHYYMFHEEIQHELRKKFLALVLNVPNRSLMKTVLLYLRSDKDGGLQCVDGLSDIQRQFITECGHCVPLFENGQ